MRRKERALVIIQRASAIAAVAVFVLWVAGLWWNVVWTSSRGYAVYLGSGSLGVYFAQPTSPSNFPLGFSFLGPGFTDSRMRLPVRWWFHGWSTPATWLVAVPLWIFEVPTLALAAALWRRSTTAARRAKAGQCVACGYNRSGLAPEHPCPECGAATSNR